MFGPFGSLREISRPAGTGQRRPGHSSAGRPATHQVGQSNSGRLEPEFAAAAILRLPLPFGGPEARWETGRPRGGRGGFPATCASARARAHTHTHARTHARTDAQGAVVAVDTGIPFRGVFQGLRELTFPGGQGFSRPAVVWGKWARREGFGFPLRSFCKDAPRLWSLVMPPLPWARTVSLLTPKMERS